MPRAVWSGSISFGLVNIPIKLYNSVSRKGVSFNQIDSRTGSRIKMKRVSAVESQTRISVSAGSSTPKSFSTPRGSATARER